jgi:hypothetical protein
MGMSKHYTKQERRIDIEFRPSNRATAHGGQFGMNGLAHEFGLWDRVKKDRRLDPRTHCGKGFDPCVYVAAFIFSFTSGGDSLADAGRLDDDDSLKAILGVEKFPDETALGEWLRNIGDEGAAALREIVQEFVQWALGCAKSERLLHVGQLESFFDDTQLEVSGQCFEGAKLNYAGKVALSWQTLWVGPFVVDGVVGSPADHKEPLSSGETGNDVSAWLPEMIERNKHLWAGQTSYLYADSASSAGKYLEAIEEGFDQYTVSYNRRTRALERNASLLPEVAWSKEQIIRWRDGHDHLTQYARLRYRPAAVRGTSSMPCAGTAVPMASFSGTTTSLPAIRRVPRDLPKRSLNDTGSKAITSGASASCLSIWDFITPRARAWPPTMSTISSGCWRSTCSKP